MKIDKQDHMLKIEIGGFRNRLVIIVNALFGKLLYIKSTTTTFSEDFAKLIANEYHKYKEVVNGQDD